MQLAYRSTNTILSAADFSPAATRAPTPHRKWARASTQAKERTSRRTIGMILNTSWSIYTESFCSARYWNDKYFEALKIIGEAAEKNNLTLGEVCLHHIRTLIVLIADSNHFVRLLSGGSTTIVSSKSTLRYLGSTRLSNSLMYAYREYGDAIIIGASNVKHIQEVRSFPLYDTLSLLALR